MCFDLIRISSEYLFSCSAVESFEDFERWWLCFFGGRRGGGGRGG